MKNGKIDASTLKGASRLYKKFIGRASRKLTRRQTSHPAAVGSKGGKLAVAKLGNLTYLKVRNPHIEGGLIVFPAGERPRLLSHSNGRQYYFDGGRQNLDGLPAAYVNPATLNSAQFSRAGLVQSPPLELVLIGVVTELGYVERKGVEDFQRVQYFHRTGEENGKRPILCYDPERKQMHLVGGDYRTLWNGINN
jgi:hypothetical protein